MMVLIMPTVNVYGLSESLTETELGALHRAILDALVIFPETGVTGEADVFIRFPRELMKSGLGTVINIEVIDLPKRAKKLLERIAANVGRTVAILAKPDRVRCKAQCIDPKAVTWWAYG